MLDAAPAAGLVHSWAPLLPVRLKGELLACAPAQRGGVMPATPGEKIWLAGYPLAQKNPAESPKILHSN